MPKPRLIVMVKLPRPGRVKTRLARDMGKVSALWWYRHQVRGLLRRLRDPRWDLVLAVTPDHAGLRSRAWPDHLPRLPQGRGDLGRRMMRAMQTGHVGPVCLIGSDVPGVARRHIARAFRALRGGDAVFGPSQDGGFWLIGLRHPYAYATGQLSGPRWSTGHALADTVACLPGARIGYIDQLRDVDTLDDLRMTRRGGHDSREP